MLHKLPIVGVMGSGQTGWDDLAVPLGQALAKLGVHLLTGGGRGVMESVTRGFTSVENRQGISIGCIPTEKQEDGSYTAKDGYPNPYVELPILSPLGVYAGTDLNQLSRNYINIMTANVILALPGAGGTLNEIGLSVLFKKRIGLLGPHELTSDLFNELPHFTTVPDAVTWVQAQLAKG